jgi:tellurite resistance protein TerA
MAIDYTKRPAQPAGSSPAAASAATPSTPISLSKITLTKSAPSISLTKAQGAGGQMRVNLNWTQGAAASGGFLKRAVSGGVSGSIDLDLGALWETQDGNKGVVQALGNSFGALDSPPYVFLDGDDRSGKVTGGENLTVNLDQLGKLRRVLVYAFIYEGAPNWAAANAIVTMFPQGAAPIEVRLDEAARDRRFCAIAMLTNDGGNLRVDREVNYIKGTQRHLDEAYGWGLRWAAGRK